MEMELIQKKAKGKKNNVMLSFLLFILMSPFALANIIQSYIGAESNINHIVDFCEYQGVITYLNLDNLVTGCSLPQFCDDNCVFSKNIISTESCHTTHCDYAYNNITYISTICQSIYNKDYYFSCFNSTLNADIKMTYDIYDTYHNAEADTVGREYLGDLITSFISEILIITVLALSIVKHRIERMRYVQICSCLKALISLCDLSFVATILYYGDKDNTFLFAMISRLITVFFSFICVVVINKWMRMSDELKSKFYIAAFSLNLDYYDD
jgi:hypothetical protein